MSNLRGIQELVSGGESERIEFKRSTGQRTDAAKAVCGMLNGLGGFVLFGVANKGEIVGQQVTAKPWNPIIANVFYRAGVIERWGSGTLNIMDWCKENANPVPTGTNRPGETHPALVSGISQFQLVHIHPFCDGNGRVSRLLSMLCLYREGYDFKRLFTISEFYDRDRLTCYRAIQSVREQGMDLTGWLEFFLIGHETQMREVKERGKRVMQVGYTGQEAWAE